MSLIKTVLKEMTDADVRFISLVDRAANRIPFRIAKSAQEQQMINLNSLSRVMKRDRQVEQKAEPPAVAALVVMDQPEPVMAQITQVLGEAGFRVDNVRKSDDGTVLFSQLDGDADPADGGQVVKLSNDLLVVMKGFDSWSAQLAANADFNEVLAAQGFTSGLNGALDALFMTCNMILSNSASPDEASSSLTAACKKFTAYVVGLATALPAVAFKADRSVTEVVAKGKKTPNDPDGDGDNDKADFIAGGKTADDWNKLSDADRVKWSKANKESKMSKTETTQKSTTAITAEIDAAQKKPDFVSEGTWTNATNAEKHALLEWQKMSAVATKTDPANQIPVSTDANGEAQAHNDEDEKLNHAKNTVGSVQKGDPSLADVLAAVKGLSEQVTTLKVDLGKVTETQETFKKTVDEVARKADSAANMVKNTVLAGAGAADTPSNDSQVTRKMDDVGFGNGVFDTAYLPKNRGRRS